MTQKMKMIIDTDPGVDDAMAIFYAALAPEIDLLGLTSVFGNVTVETATRNALRLLELSNQEAPVAQGAAAPLARGYNPPSAMVHGAEGFGDIPAETPARKPLEESAAEFLVRMAREHKGELVLCPIGPITNIAQAIQLDPDFAGNLRKIVFMGGAGFVPGNITAHAEANTFNDPHALNIVLRSDAPCVMVGLDVTMKELFTSADFDTLARLSPDLGGFLKRAGEFYLGFYRDFHKVDGCGLHDAMAIIAATHPELFVIERHAVDVVEDGERIGQTQIVTEGGAPTDICVGGDLRAVVDRFIQMFERSV